MKELPRHREAFEYYVALGLNRGLIKVGKKMGVSTTTACKWSVAFEWQKRIAKRDAKNGRAIAKKTDAAIVKNAADYADEIGATLSVIRGSIKKVDEALRDDKMGTPTYKNLAALATSQKELVRALLLLSGEADSHTAHTLKVKHIYPEGHEPRKIIDSEAIDGT